MARHRGARVRHRRPEHRAHLHRGRAVRRHQGKRHRPRRQRSTASSSSPSSSTSASAASEHSAAALAHDVRARRLIPLLAACSAIGSVGNYLFLPALPQIGDALRRRSRHRAAHHHQPTWSSFAFGVLLSGPLADRFGRRPMLIGGVALVRARPRCCATSRRPWAGSSRRASCRARPAASASPCHAPASATCSRSASWRACTPSSPWRWCSARALAPCVGRTHHAFRRLAVRVSLAAGAGAAVIAMACCGVAARDARRRMPTRTASRRCGANRAR